MTDYHDEDENELATPMPDMEWPTSHSTFAPGDRVLKTKGSSWHGTVCGWYRTALTPEGYCVESEREPGSVQLYPVAALTSAEQSTAPYGYCPECGAAGEMRERRTNGNDVCTAGHKYPSSSALARASLRGGNNG